MGVLGRVITRRGVGQHERQDVMVYLVQEWGQHGQGVPCPQHQP